MNQATLDKNYQLLNITADATDAAIEQAYRRAARQLHPDLNPDPKASHQLATITQAFEELLAARRNGLNPTNKPMSQPKNEKKIGVSGETPIIGGKKRKGEDYKTTIDLSAQELQAGSSKTITLNYQVDCEQCFGTGGDLAGVKSTCTQCRGIGVIARTSEQCQQCFGTGTIPTNVCLKCHGNKKINYSHDLHLTLPPHLKDGELIKLPRRGIPGTGGGLNGDLHLLIQVRLAPGYLRAGNNLGLDLDIHYATLILGGSVNITGAYNEPQTLVIKPNSKPGDIVTIVGAGLGSDPTGDLMVRLGVRLDVVNEKEKMLLQQIQQLSNVS